MTLHEALKCFNPSTGLMLISTLLLLVATSAQAKFQSLDWVDVDFDLPPQWSRQWHLQSFQSLDWVDVDFDTAPKVRGYVKS